jgi:hypothetical protein
LWPTALAPSAALPAASPLQPSNALSIKSRRPRPCRARRSRLDCADQRFAAPRSCQIGVRLNARKPNNKALTVSGEEREHSDDGRFGRVRAKKCEVLVGV